MTDGVFDRVEGSLPDYRPKTQREFVAMQIANRFQDTHRLGRYLLVGRTHPKKVLLEAARLAMLRRDLNRSPLGDLFFEVLAEFDREERGHD